MGGEAREAEEITKEEGRWVNERNRKMKRGRLSNVFGAAGQTRKYFTP
jgi:hypothetical protein